MRNRKIIAYAIAEHHHSAYIPKIVGEMIKGGYEPYGSMIYVPDVVADGCITPGAFFQPMVKYSDE